MDRTSRNVADSSMTVSTGEDGQGVTSAGLGGKFASEATNALS